LAPEDYGLRLTKSGQPQRMFLGRSPVATRKPTAWDFAPIRSTTKCSGGRASARPADWSGSFRGSCKCGGITTGRVLLELGYWHAYSLAAILQIFWIRFVRRASDLNDKASMPPPRWTGLPWPKCTMPTKHGGDWHPTLKRAAQLSGHCRQRWCRSRPNCVYGSLRRSSQRPYPSWPPRFATPNCHLTTRKQREQVRQRLVRGCGKRLGVTLASDHNVAVQSLAPYKPGRQSP